MLCSSRPLRPSGSTNASVLWNRSSLVTLISPFLCCHFGLTCSILSVWKPFVHSLKPLQFYLPEWSLQLPLLYSHSYFTTIVFLILYEALQVYFEGRKRERCFLSFTRMRKAAGKGPAKVRSQRPQAHLSHGWVVPALEVSSAFFPSSLAGCWNGGSSNLLLNLGIFGISFVSFCFSNF